MEDSDNSIIIIQFLATCAYPSGKILQIQDVRDLVEQQIGMRLKADNHYHAVREAFHYLSNIKGYIRKTSTESDGKYEVLIPSKGW